MTLPVVMVAFFQWGVGSEFYTLCAVYLIIQAGDLSPVYSPEPYHERYMRDVRVAFTTAGSMWWRAMSHTMSIDTPAAIWIGLPPTTVGWRSLNRVMPAPVRNSKSR